PREVLGVAPLRGTGGDIELRHLLGVHVLVDRRVARRAERLEQREDLLLLDQLAHDLDRLRRAVAVIQADEVDLAAVDAARRVDGLPVGVDRFADRSVGRSGTTIGIGVAELDLGVAGTVVVFLLTGCDRARKCRRSRPRRDERTPTYLHFALTSLLRFPILHPKQSKGNRDGEAPGWRHNNTRRGGPQGLREELALWKGKWCPGAGSNHRHCDFQKQCFYNRNNRLDYCPSV